MADNKFWGGAILGLVAGAVVVKMWASRRSAGSPPPAFGGRQMALMPPQGMAGMGQHPNVAMGLPVPQSRGDGSWGTRNGIPTVPLPAESARRTSQLRGKVPPPPPPPSAARSAQGETFGGESGMGGENF